MEKEEKKLFDEALKVYKIAPEYVFDLRHYPKSQEVVICTNGGQKIRHKQGEPAKRELTEVQITGELPKEEKKISIKGLLKKIKKQPRS